MAPYDDPKIGAEDVLIRRIHPRHHIVQDSNRGFQRVSTKAFSASSSPDGGMSVDIEALIVEAGLDPRQFVTTPKYVGSVAFPAGLAREFGLLIGGSPSPRNPYHGEVWGSAEAKPFASSQKKALLNGCKWYVEIPDVSLP